VEFISTDKKKKLIKGSLSNGIILKDIFYGN